MQNLGSLLDTLLKAKIDFVLIGGFASVIHGSSMVTQDIDVCMMINPAQIEKLRDCLREFNPTHRMTPKRLSFLEFPSDVSSLKNVYLETDLGVLDVISEVTGVGSFAAVSAHAAEIEIYGKKCKVISLEDLIASKKALGRGKDLVVVRELEVIQKNRDK